MRNKKAKQSKNQESARNLCNISSLLIFSLKHLHSICLGLMNLDLNQEKILILSDQWLRVPVAGTNAVWAF